jgi:AcrR family transcriptional regulator
VRTEAVTSPGDKKEAARQARTELNRNLLLSGARQVFAEHGFDAAKMEDIVREAGLSLGTAYAVFRGKAELYQALHEIGDRDLLERGAASAVGISDCVEVLLAGVRATVGYFLENPDFLRIHLRESSAWAFESSGVGSSERARAWEEGIRMMTAAFARCIDEGRFVAGDPRTMSRLAVAMQQVHLAVWVEGGMLRSPQSVTEEIVEQVARSFVKNQNHDAHQ